MDKDVPVELLGPLGCGIQTGAGVVLNAMRLAPGQSIVVFGVGTVGLAAVRVLGRPGRCVLVGAGADTLTILPAELAGRQLTYVYEGSAVPHEFIPHLIRLWRSGRFPFERLIRQYPLDEIDRAEADTVEGRTVKPVLVPSPNGTSGQAAVR